MAKDDEEKGAAAEKSGAAKGTETQANGTGLQTGANAASSNGKSGETSSSQGSSSANALQAGASPASASGSAKTTQDAIALLKADHRAVEKLFKAFETADDDRKDEIVQEACEALILHALVEEEIFYPACREAASDEEPLDEAQVEHDSAKLLIVELLEGEADDEYRDAKFKVLAEQVKHHVAEEEKPGSGIMAKAQAARIDLAELGRRIQMRKQQVQSRQADLRPTRPVSFRHLSDDEFSRGGGRGSYSSPRGERDMPRNQGPDRDERGRFTSDDDDRGGRSGSSRSGGRDHGGWYGDSEGHSRAARSRSESRSYADYDDDDRRYRSRGRDDDDDRGRGRGGWFGDSEGHSEAARRGWDDPDHGPSGWYGDSRGHSEAARRGWDNPDHGRSGWYGDPEGHSEASRRGWEERGGGGGRSSRDDDDRGYRSRSSRDDDDDRRSRSRSRDDDDDRGYRSRSRDDDDDRGGRSSSRSGGGGGRGGWFGDSRGHAEAARRGWEDRR